MSTPSIVLGQSQPLSDASKKRPDVDSRNLHQVVQLAQQAIQAATQRSYQSRTPDSPNNKRDLRFRLQQLPGGLQTPPAGPSSPQQQETPRTQVAKAMSAQLSLSNAKKEFNFDGVLTVASVALKQKEPPKNTLEKLLDDYKIQFGTFLKSNSQDPKNPTEALVALNSVFLAVKDREFLDRYIVRHSLPQDQQKEFISFHDKLNTLKEKLAKAGVNGPKPEDSINFWSGREGQTRAAEDEESLSDSDVPLFKFLFDCWGYIKKQHAKHPEEVTERLIPLLPILFSAMFADFASGDVNVYMSSKNDGKQSVINVESAFWSAELYALKQNPAVAKVNLYLHKGVDPVANKDIWEQPIDLKSQDPNEIKRQDALVALSKRGDKTLKVSMGAAKGVIASWKSRTGGDSELVQGSKKLNQDSSC